ncbi:MAG TPA: DUF262 domain-containing protein [Blastocatellia bacterium]|nr:DUF262 domain-containing protein [Blastocatellia bacterium]
MNAYVLDTSQEFGMIASTARAQANHPFELQEDDMPRTITVNLDALIPRADFEIIESTSQSSPPPAIAIRDLEGDAFFFSGLRKPDFQRETVSWSPKKIHDFVKTFVDGDLIPALILWRSQGTNFIIDGAHRLSALIAWVNDDYGDGELSRKFFTAVIEPQQKKMAERTRALINKNIGSYKDHQFAVKHPEKSKPDVVSRALLFGQISIQLQWVSGDSKKAESSFFKINQEAVPIDKTELRLLQARNKPNAMAARAIIRAGTGHKYWSKPGISEDMKNMIEGLARQIYSNLFTPLLTVPIKTLDLPVAGQSYSSQTLPLIFELVNITNEHLLQDIVDDTTGDETVQFLKNVRGVANRISSTHPTSLGLHPVVYFYSSEGRFQPTSFLAVISLLQSFEKEDLYRVFTDHRKDFEEFLVKYKDYSNQVIRKWGSGVKAFDKQKDLYRLILDKMIEGKSEAEILKHLAGHDLFGFLAPIVSQKRSVSADFTPSTRSEAFLRDAIDTPVRCGICQARLHIKSITTDHVLRKAEGGQGEVDNAQNAHPYCNTVYKH